MAKEFYAELEKYGPDKSKKADLTGPLRNLKEEAEELRDKFRLFHPGQELKVLPLPSLSSFILLLL